MSQRLRFCGCKIQQQGVIKMCISEKPADPKRILHISTKPARNFGTDTTILHGDGSTTVIKNAPNGSGIPTFRGLGNYHGDDSSELAAAMVKKEI